MSGPVERWRASPEPSEPSQARAAALLRQVPAPPALSAEQLERIEDRLRARARQGKAPMPAWLKWAIGVGAFGGAPLAFAAVMKLVFAPAASTPEAERHVPSPAGQSQAAPAPPAASASATDIPAAAPSAAAGSSALAMPAASSRPVVAPSAGGAPPMEMDLRPRAPAASKRAAAPAPAASPAVSASTLKDESALLAAALSKLRADHDPAGALESLDAYRLRFPDGVLRDEARVGRVDALLALGRRPDARAELAAIGSGKLGAMPRGLELRVLEAELEAEAGHCDRATALFDALLAQPSPAVEERSLFGRATCRAKRGEPDGAAADLRRLLQRHPHGEYAPAAEKLLQDVGGD